MLTSLSTQIVLIKLKDILFWNYILDLFVKIILNLLYDIFYCNILNQLLLVIKTFPALIPGILY